jgi:hypothetical protein
MLVIVFCRLNSVDTIREQNVYPFILLTVLKKQCLRNAKFISAFLSSIKVYCLSDKNTFINFIFLIYFNAYISCMQMW